MEGKLINILVNTELLLTKKTKEEWLQWAKENKGKNIFFGVGLMTKDLLSEAIPFDILGMIFLAELFRQLLIADNVFIFVADQHAITNHSIPLDKIEKRTHEMLLVLHSIIRAFKLQHFTLIQTTNLNFDESIKKIYRELPNIFNDYLKHEIADTLWLNQFHNVRIKLGWGMSLEQVTRGHDERFFDNEIKKLCPTISFIHTKPGRTANEKRQRVSPYISIAGEDRLLLRRNETAVEKLIKWREDKNNTAIKPMLRHLSQIVRLHDQLFKRKDPNTLEGKIHTLITQIMLLEKMKKGVIHD